jgi:hypothetical protein
MRGAAIDNENDRALRAGNEALQKISKMTAALTPPLPMIMNRMWPRDVIAATVRAGISVATGYFASPYRKSIENACRDVQVPCLGSRQHALGGRALNSLPSMPIRSAGARCARSLEISLYLSCKCKHPKYETPGRRARGLAWSVLKMSACATGWERKS